MSTNLLSLNQSKTEFLVIGLPQKLSKMSNSCLSMPSYLSIIPTGAARNRGVIFDSTLYLITSPLFLKPVSFLFVAFIALETIATSLIHLKVDYCNSLFPNFRKSELDRLQFILNSTARAVSESHSQVSPLA